MSAPTCSRRQLERAIAFEYFPRLYQESPEFRKLIADPEQLLATMHEMGFKTSLNLHPASGIRPIEDCSQMEKAMKFTATFANPLPFIKLTHRLT